MTCLLILSISSSAEQKFLIVMESSPIKYFLHGLFLWCVSEKLTPYPRSSRSSMVSSRSLIILCFTFKLIHFNLIFVEGIRPMTDYYFCFFFFCHVNVKFFQHYLLKTLSVLYCVPLLFCYESVDYVYVVVFWELSVLFHSSLCLFFRQYYIVLISGPLS